jgi:hypothetical protein
VHGREVASDPPASRLQRAPHTHVNEQVATFHCSFHCKFVPDCLHPISIQVLSPAGCPVAPDKAAGRSRGTPGQLSCCQVTTFLIRGRRRAKTVLGSGEGVRTDRCTAHCNGTRDRCTRARLCCRSTPCCACARENSLFAELTRLQVFPLLREVGGRGYRLSGEPHEQKRTL